MTIARDSASQYGSDAEARKAFDGVAPARELLVEDLVPIDLRADRLTRQIASFERAGYRLETRTALQAVVVKPRERRRGLAHLSVSLLRPLGFGGSQHRVVITVDRSGAVRFV